MKRESTLAQMCVDVGKKRLVLVHRHELHLGVNDQHIFQDLFGAAINQHLAALNINLQ
jgi:hypothetical protein